MDDEDATLLAANATAAVVGVVELCAVLVQRGAIDPADTENVEDVMLRALRGSATGAAHRHQREQLQAWFQRLREADRLPEA